MDTRTTRRGRTNTDEKEKRGKGEIGFTLSTEENHAGNLLIMVKDKASR